MLKQVMIAVLAISATVSSGQDAQPSRWIVKATTHELDGSVDYSAVLPSARPLLGTVGQAENAVFYAVCGQHGLALGVVWPDIVDYDPQINSAVLAWSLDGGKVHNDLWDADVKSVGMHGGKARKLLASLLSAKRFVILVPDHHGNQEAVFDLTGIQAATSTLPCAAKRS
ncbi:hypothetical protein [Rhodoferax sp.]|uniref:hypothetical protein n=1 Tax=Rhodoferax sp. TaxID=50421 RepID=UPI00374D1284